MSPHDKLDPRVAALLGGRRRWWDVREGRFVNADTIYIPFGCPDWGERGGTRNSLCTFCALPNAVQAYREAFYDGRPIPAEEQLRLVRAALAALDGGDDERHTIMLFNAGSFLAMPPPLQERIAEELATRNELKRVVIESRAELVIPSLLDPLTRIFAHAGKALTIRIGVETQDDHLRLHVLRKGHARRQLAAAVETANAFGVSLGGYALLNPAPGLDREWTIAEAKRTLDWILGEGPAGLGMAEAYFCSTNVGPGTPLEREWREGRFTPATPWTVLAVLRYAIAEYGTRVHLLPFRDEPELLAVPSNHVPGGIPQSLEGAV